MPVQFLGEDANSYTWDSGSGPVTSAKDGSGQYEAVKQAAASQAPQTDAPSAVGAPPLSSSMPDPTQAPGPQAPTAPLAPPVTPTIPPLTSSADPAPVPMSAPSQPQMPLTVPMTNSTTTTGSTILDPAMKNAYLNNAADAANAATSQGEIESKLQKGLAGVAQDKQNIHGDMANIEASKAQMIEQEHQQFRDNVVEGYKKLIAQKVEPKSIFESGNVGQNIAAGLAIALGAMGQALTGKENQGLKVIQDAIDRDFKAQQQAVENNRHALNDLGVAYKSGLDMGMSEKDAELHAKAYVLDKTADQGMQLTATSNSDLVKANAQRTAASLRGAADEAVMKATPTTIQRATQTQDTPLSKLMPMSKLSDAEKTSVMGHKTTDDAIQDIRQFTKDVFGAPPTGKSADLIRQAGKTLGFQDPNVAVLQQKLKGISTDQMHQLFGSRLTDPEIKQGFELLPSFEDKPDVFSAKLDELDRKNAQAYGNFRKMQPIAEGLKYPELRSPHWKEYSGGSNGTPDYFTPKAK